MPLTPINRIDEYAALTTMFEELSRMEVSEIYDPEALTRRCAVMAADTHRLVNITLGRIRTETIMTLQTMVAEGKLTPQLRDVLAPRALAVWASDDELSYLTSTAASSYSTLVLLRVARYIFVTIAFVVSFLVSELVARQVPDAGSSIISRLIVGLFAFITQMLLFGNVGERCQRFIRWRLFERRREKLLSALKTFIDVCSRVWSEANSFIPLSY